MNVKCLTVKIIRLKYGSVYLDPQYLITLIQSDTENSLFSLVSSLVHSYMTGGLVLVSFSMVSAVGLSNLSAVNMGLPRNQCIIGISLVLGIMLPTYMRDPDVKFQTGEQRR